jgi:hypothetical protein
MNLAKPMSALAVAGLTVTVLGARPALAAGPVRIEHVQYDSP